MAEVAIIVQTWKEVSDGDHSQKTCKVGVSGDYTFVVSEAVVGPYGLLLQCLLLRFIIPWNKLAGFRRYERLRGVIQVKFTTQHKPQHK